MGRSNYNKRQNFVIQRGEDGNRRVYNDFHDDRGPSNSNSMPVRTQNRVWSRLGGDRKQVNFVDDGPRGGGIRKNNKRGGNRNLAYIALQEHDDEMGDRRGEQSGRARSLPGRMPRSRFSNRGSRLPPPGTRRPAQADTLFSWHKITLRNGAKYEKMALLKELAQKTSVPFRPICYTKQGNNTHFFVEDQTAAKALKDLDRRIELPDGPQLVINLDRSTPPNVTLSEDLVNKMMLVMSKRYNAQNKALNLKAFHTDDDFLGDSFFAPLWRSNVMAKVLTIIGDQIPETTAIDLGDNKLLNLDNMNLLKQKAPNVNILHLANNRLREARTLDKIKDLKLIELKLVGNPIVEKLDTSYVSVVRKMFPTLQFLDDKELPKEIGFDVESEADPSLPETIPKLIKNEAAGAVVLQFLHQFFTLYDSDSRQPLLDAYHEHAMMSMACVGPFESLKAYITESRNLTRISDSRQHKLLHRGRLQVVSFLSSLPKTQHDPTTFTLDVPFTSEKLMTFTVTGMFKEREAKNAKIMHFNRCFVVVPHGTGFCIVNEILFISFAQPGNAKKAFTSPDSQLAAPAPAAAAPAPAAYPAVPAQLGVEAKRTMATAFAEKSGMNVEWSVKCLEENTWDFDKSAVVFAELKNQGKIPPEAFVK